MEYKFIRSFSSLSYMSICSSKVSTECGLVLPFSISSILSFHESHPVAVYVFFLVFPLLLSFTLCCLQQRVSEDSFYARCDPSN